MSARNVSLKDEAYDRLRAARRYPAESFSEVVLRATWPEDTVTAGALLARLRSRGPHFSPAELDRMDTVRRDDTLPEDKWAGR